MAESNKFGRWKLTYARASLRLLHLQATLVKWGRQHGIKALTLIAVITFCASMLAVPVLQTTFNWFFTVPENFASLKKLLGGTSSALLGATAIAFSLILFAMQVNVERMPHGLFKRLSSDWKLLGAFLISFISALTVGAMSLTPTASRAAFAIMVTIWAIVLILGLFVIAYRRALFLISPTAQLSIMAKQVHKEFRTWEHGFVRLRPIIQDLQKQSELVLDENQVQFDAAKAEYFRVNFNWDRNARQAIQYSMSYAQRFSEVGDHEVAESAIRGVIQINTAYCTVKSGTFVGSNLFFEASGSTDGLINSTLESFRQMMRVALSRGDEQLIEHTLKGIASLISVYVVIKYPGRNTSKRHAGLAAGYLEAAVESVLPHNMPDVIMEGLRLMGDAARSMLMFSGSTEIISLVNKIAFVSYAGMVKPDYRPATLVAFDQLSLITFELIVGAKDDISYPVSELRSAIKSAVLVFFEVPSTSLMSIHSSNLAPYYSSASMSSLRSKFLPLVNEILNAPANNKDAIRIIGNIEVWADQIYSPQKELLLAAVNKRLGFTSDLLQWAVGISEMFLAVSSAPACDDYEKESLQKHATWLLSTISFLPDDADSVRFVATFSVTELLFDAAIDSRKWDCEDYYVSAKDLLFQWTMKGGKHQTGWGILTRGVQGLAGLTLSEPEVDVSGFVRKLKIALAGVDAPSLELRQSAAQDLRREAGRHRGREMNFSKLDQVLERVDQAALRTLMLDVVALLDGAEQK